MRLVMGGFELADFSRHCWEGLVVDRLHAVGYLPGCKSGYFELALFYYWGQAGWDGFVV